MNHASHIFPKKIINHASASTVQTFADFEREGIDSFCN